MVNSVLSRVEAGGYLFRFGCTKSNGADFLPQYHCELAVVSIQLIRLVLKLRHSRQISTTGGGNAEHGFQLQGNVT